MQAKGEQIAPPIARHTPKKCGAKFGAFAVKDQKRTLSARTRSSRP